MIDNPSRGLFVAGCTGSLSDTHIDKGLEHMSNKSVPIP